MVRRKLSFESSPSLKLGFRRDEAAAAFGSVQLLDDMWRAGWLKPVVNRHKLVLFDRGDEVAVQAGDDGIRFLLVSGKPLQEPVAWYGPIVMNTQEQLQKAFEELREGTFLKAEQE